MVFVNSDRSYNKPDIVIVDKRTNKATIIDVAIPNNHNLAENV